MGFYVPIKSVCGAITTQIDSYDYDLNPEGVICCGHCHTILEAREAWYQVYDGVSF